MINSIKKHPPRVMSVIEITPSDKQRVLDVIEKVQDNFKMLHSEHGLQELPYIPWIFLARNALDSCLTLASDPLPSSDPKRATLYSYIWDHETFLALPTSIHCPPVRLPRSKVLTTNSPWLSCVFGYKPYQDEDPETHKITV